MMYHEEYPPLTAPACSDEVVQKLRDQWRPSAQSTWQPYAWIDSETGALSYRDEAYDTTQASLWMFNPMYVIPPAIAGPLHEELEARRKSPLFQQEPDHEAAILHGARRFMQRFLWGTTVFNELRDASYGDARANFNHFGGPTGSLAAGVNRLPRVDVSAPILERNIDYCEAPSLQPSFMPDDLNSRIIDNINQERRRRREGTLGWTVPIADQATHQYSHSLLRVKNHLIGVNWFCFPGERLSFTFQFPQLTLEGEATLGELVTDLEHLVPVGTNYNTLYSYHERGNGRMPEDAIWRGTEEDRARPKTKMWWEIDAWSASQ